MTDTSKLLDKGERQMYEWMCRLVRDMAGRGATIASYYVDADYSRAREIVDFLPKPVDPDLIEAREICTRDACYTQRMAEAVRDGDYDGTSTVRNILSAIKRGRELERDGK
jgi:hypothetical protein